MAGTSSNKIPDPHCINFDDNDVMYLCGHNLGYVVKSPGNYTSQALATPNYGDHINSLIFDVNGSMYTNDHNGNLVRRYSSSSPNGTIIAGTGSSVSGTITYPTGLAIDNQFNLYIADQDADKIFWLAPGSSALVPVINLKPPMDKPLHILFPPGSSDSLYITDDQDNVVYLWKFNAATPSSTLSSVIDGTTLKEPKGMKLDPDGNLYVADNKNKRIVLFCVNSTVGVIVASLTGEPIDLAFDSQMNMYVLTKDGFVLKHDLM